MKSILFQFYLFLIFFFIGHCKMPVVEENRGKPAEHLRQSCSLRKHPVKKSLLGSIERLRQKKGVLDLVEDPVLNLAARHQVNRLAAAGYLYHRDRDGGPLNRLRKMGLQRHFVGENIARLPLIPEPGKAVFRGWRDRPQEYQNLISPRYLRMGVAMLPTAEYCYCVLILTN